MSENRQKLREIGRFYAKINQNRAKSLKNVFLKGMSVKNGVSRVVSGKWVF
jgi:hypothetical protein